MIYDFRFVIYDFRLECRVGGEVNGKILSIFDMQLSVQIGL